jgi:hypothetical protein
MTMAEDISANLPLAVERERPRAAPLVLHRVVWALAAAGLALRLAFALLPLSVHLVVLEDDAWMVTAIARNFALGRGITADGVNPTNGFQPLYPLTLGALPYLAAPNQLDAGFTANLVLCALLNILALWPLWWLARRFGGEVAGLLAAALFALNPFLVRVSVNAMETSLGLLLLLALFVAFYQLDLSRALHVLGLALVTALATLARLDASLAFAAIALTMALRAFRRTTNDERRTTNDSDKILSVGRWSVAGGQLSMVALYVAATLAFLAPYFAFNYSISGTLGPSSGAALAYLHSYREQFHLTGGLSALFQNSAVDLAWLPSTWAQLLVVIAFGGALWLAVGARLLAALPLLLYIPVPPLYYGYILQQQRERYFVGLSAILIIVLAWLGAELWRRLPKRATALALGAGVALVVALNTREAIGFYQTKLTERDQTQPTLYQAALWARDNLPRDALIGAKNSGIFQYYSGHVALNIDGKLNHEIVPAMERRELLDYLRRRGVEYLVDRELVTAAHIAFYSHQFGPAPEHHTPSLPQRIVIYGKILADKLGAQLPLGLDAQSGWSPTRPFSDAAEIVQRFPRPNDATNPVVVYRLKPAGAPGVP